MARALVLLLPVALLGLFCLPLTAPAQASLPAFRSPFPAGASIAEAARAGGSSRPAVEVYREAHALGRSLEEAMEDAERARREGRIERLLDGLARRPDAATLPWAAWLDECRQGNRALAPGLLRGAARALGSAAVVLAREANDRYSPVELRVAALQVLWARDAMDGFNACNRALREEPRYDLHERVVDEVLAACPGPLAEELLLDALGNHSQVAERARRSAVALLARWRSARAVATLGQILLSERSNVLLRKEAGEALITIGSPEALRAIAAVDSIDAEAEPVFAAYLDTLRRRIGLPPIGS
jgi:hypothetical protein